ncbi:MAG: bifunctional alpha/beta hydrolase/OsmC family protein [Bacteroidales bacterium]|nr:bifunctional alpha/beta hydrolase/OsmC family protein [Bacteroidales bacterium]
MRTKKLRFTNQSGEKLVARLELPVDSHPQTYAVFAHCFTCNKNLHAVTNISRALSLQGIGVLRFDFTGLGESEGDFADTNFSSNVDDLVEAANYLAEHYAAPQILIGHSLGGAAVIFASSRLPSVKAVATIGAPSNPTHVEKLLKSGVDEIKEKGEARISIAGRGFTVKKQFLDDLEASHVESVMKKFDKALLVMHAPFDQTVGVNNAADIFQMAKHPKSFVSLDKADHLLSRKEDSEYAGNIIAAWAKKFINLPEKPALKTKEQVVARLGEEKFTTEIRAGQHGLIADEPTDVGGNDFGPSPYYLVSSALAACTAMTLRMYAERKDWQLDEVKVHVNHNKTYKDDCDACEQPSSKIDRFERIIEVEGELDEKQKQRLLEIANKCPVHRTLHNEVMVDTRIKGESPGG